MAPLYFALGLGFGSVRWWRFFTPDQCGAINTLVAHFSMPFFTFDFLTRADPYAMNRRVVLAVLAVAAWARFCCCDSGSGGAKAKAAAGARSSWPALVWFPLLLLGFELRKAWVGGGGGIRPPSAVAGEGAAASRCGDDQPSPRRAGVAAIAAGGRPGGRRRDEHAAEQPGARAGIRLWPTVRTVGLKLARNPNVFASVLGVHCLQVGRQHAGRGDGVAAGDVQDGNGDEHVQHAWASGLAAALRFVAGPLATLAGAVAFGLRGDVLRFAIIQAALLQCIASFVFAKEYGLHADVLSTT
ncbi:unnamed protein product [Urochloa decumbens]|uniref:Uncharacterized protein n=1 Tax=Urochloa decumbens TaxID=240449 RepID=A0ABC9BE33_9POAL